MTLTETELHREQKLAATVRECLFGYTGPGPIPDAHAALDSILAAYEEMQRERDLLREEIRIHETCECGQEPTSSWLDAISTESSRAAES